MKSDQIVMDNLKAKIEERRKILDSRRYAITIQNIVDSKFPPRKFLSGSIDLVEPDFYPSLVAFDPQFYSDENSI